MEIENHLKPTEQKVELKFNVDTVLFVIYLFYKCNLLTRHHLRTMFKIIKIKDGHGDIAKYLVEEEMKAI